MCQSEAYSLPLAWSEYREFGTEFIKASTSPKSIADQLKKALDVLPSDKIKIGKLARKWVIDNFSSDVIGSNIEKFIDSCEYGNYENTEKKYIEKNPYAQIAYIEDPILWLKSLYSLILKTDVSDSDEGLLHWVEKLKSGISRQAIESFFRETAAKDNDKYKIFKIEELFSGSNPEDRIFVSIDSNLENIFLSTKIISAIKEKYPDKKIFVGSTESCQAVFSGNTMIETALIKSKEFEDPEFLKNNFFESYCLDSFSINNNHSILIK
jgi:hypothetical protein